MNKRKKRKLYIIAAIVSAIIIPILVLCIIFIDNKTVDYESINLNGSGAEADIKIAHLSDLHFPKIKVDTEKLLNRLSAENLDLIMITGDLLDNGNPLNTGVKEFIEELKPIAPIFYVNGNHEAENKNAGALYDILTSNGVIILHNESIRITVRGAGVTVTGLTDNSGYNPSELGLTSESQQDYKILLAHRPEKWDNYSAASNAVKPDLVLSGHAHGGQFRFFGHGLLSPGQGLFPKYDSGLYIPEDSKVQMVVSRGIGNSLFPFRFNNPPHVPIITL